MSSARVRARVVGAALALALVAAPAHAADPVVYGMGDQKAHMFTDDHFTGLGLGHARRVVPWDALNVRWQRRELDHWMEAAKAAGVQPLIAFTRSRRSHLIRTLPSVDRMAQTFRKFRRRYRWVTAYTPWNEANHCSQPTCRSPRMAARYYNMMRGALQALHDRRGRRARPGEHGPVAARVQAPRQR